MKNYYITDIQEVNSDGIRFNDKRFVSFEICRKEWARENGIIPEETTCVALRNSVDNKPYFILYDIEKIKLIFDYKGLLAKYKNQREFIKFQVLLNRLGYSSYDYS